MADQDVTEQEWVRRAQAGDAHAFDRLACRYRPALQAMAFVRTGSRDIAEDLVQEVLTKAWLNIKTLQEATAFCAWLKRIAANACISWFRRAVPAEAEISESQADPRRTPLETVLARERERALHRALRELPEANRLALLMHVWGDASYEDIAAFTGVAVTTVEGRIYRARRQMRRLLAEPQSEFSAPAQVPIFSKPQPSQRIKPMKPTKRQETMEPRTQETAQAQALFSIRFTALVDAGVSLVRCLLALEEMPPPYGVAAKAIREKVQEGYRLSDAMAEWPDLFSPLYIRLVCAGEIGGTLEETLRRMADLTIKELEIVRKYGGSEKPLFLTLPSGTAAVEDWQALSAFQQTALLLIFCETFGVLLMSGVPILQTLRTMTDLLPAAQRDGMASVIEAVKQGDPMLPELERMGIFPQFILQLIHTGEESGTLDSVLHIAAEALEQELETRMLIQ